MLPSKQPSKPTCSRTIQANLLMEIEREKKPSNQRDFRLKPL